MKSATTPLVSPGSEAYDALVDATRLDALAQACAVVEVTPVSTPAGGSRFPPDGGTRPSSSVRRPPCT